MSIVRYKHWCNSGDAVGLMAGIKHVFDTTGNKGVFMQHLNKEAEYYPGAVHPVQNDTGKMVNMSNKQWDMIKPLLESQEYIDHCEEWDGQKFDINLDAFREGEFSTMPFGSLPRWSWYTHPALACDLSKPWIKLPIVDGYNENIVINFTERYRNTNVTYFFLKKYKDVLIFAGTIGEYELFCKQWKLDIPYLTVDNFYQLGGILNSCKFFLGNQSFCWNLCEAQKKPRLLEVCRQASNCIPIGENAFDFLHQGALEFYFERFMGETPALSKQI